METKTAAGPWIRPASKEKPENNEIILCDMKRGPIRLLTFKSEGGASPGLLWGTGGILQWDAVRRWARINP